MTYELDRKNGLVESRAEYDEWKRESVTVAEAADLVGRSEAETLALIKSGFHAIVLDGCYRVMVCDLHWYARAFAALDDEKSRAAP
jgi:hypothetical protein